ncbi:MAG: MBL fold metallo-hydrolase [Candidatus Buchananbacteria bacterium]
MTIQWLGQSCFKIQTKNNGIESTIVCDPFSTKEGLKMPKVQADVITVSHDHYDHNNIEAIKGDPYIINTPGEYETKEIMFYGISSFHDDKKGKERGLNTIYKIISEDLNLVHLGDLGDDLDDEQMERLGVVDILLIPVGGIYTIDSKKAIEIISKIEPRIVIPIHYKISGQETKISTADEFIKNCGLPSEKMDKLKIAKKDLPQENTKLIILSPSA